MERDLDDFERGLLEDYKIQKDYKDLDDFERGLLEDFDALLDYFWQEEEVENLGEK